MLVSFVPIENVVRVYEKGYYNYYVSYSKEGLVNEEVYDYIDNTYSFQMQDETALKYIVIWTKLIYNQSTKEIK